MERKLAERKIRGIGKARYRGERKALLQLRLTAGIVNLKKLFTLEADITGAEGCPKPRIRRARAQESLIIAASDPNTTTPKATSSAAT